MSEKKRTRKKKIDASPNIDAFKKMIDIYPPAYLPPEEEADDSQDWQEEKEVNIRQETVSYHDESEDQETDTEIYNVEKTESQTQFGQIKEENKQNLISRYKPKIKKEFKPLKQNKYLFIFLAALIFSGMLWYVGFKVMPKATIAIQTKKGVITFDNQVLMDISSSKPDAEKKVIPAQLLVFKESQSGEFTATGKNSAGAKSKGSLTIYNNFSTLPQILVATTRFTAENGLIFRLDARTIVPGAVMKDGKLQPSGIIASVTAEKMGAEYNIGPGKFQIPGFQGTPKYEKFYAVSEKAFVGGGASESKYVTSEDIKNAEKALGTKLFDLFDKDVKTKIPQDFKLLDAAKITKIDNLVVDAKVGEIRDKFNVTLGGQVKVIVFSELTLEIIIKESLKPNLIADTNFYQKPEINYQNVKVDFDKGTISAKVLADIRTHYEIDEIELKKELNNKQLSEATKLIENKSYIDQAQVNLWPAWINRIPQNNNRIRITVD